MISGDRMPRPLIFVALSLLTVLASGCESYDRPRRPLPEAFAMQVLDGGRLDAAALRGKPWVINLWVPL